MALLFLNKVPGDQNAFESKVNDIASRLGVSPNWIMFVINYETAGAFSTTIQNRINATGLFQFLPSTAISLGTTVDALKNMTATQQLDYGYKLLKPYRGSMVDYYSTYLGVFYPAALNQPDNYIFPQNVVNENPSFFTTGNTLGDFKKGLDSIVYAQVPTDYYGEFFKKKILFCRSIKESSLQQSQLSYC